MRDSTARCSATLLAILLFVLVLASAELVSPEWVDCRESLTFIEDCGDPDMPDCARTGSEGVDGTSSTSSVADKPPEDLRFSRQDIQIATADRSGAIQFSIERMAIILRLWASVASLVFAF
jgi:hypothetical protein